jgi:hypothetical protein
MLANLAYEMKKFCTGNAQSASLAKLVDALSARLTEDRKK